MKTKIFLIATVLFLLCSYGFSGPGTDAVAPDKVGINQSIIMYDAGPNPADSKCLIRVYYPIKDPNASIKIYSADSTLVKNVSLAAETGVGSAVINLTDLQAGNYTYQLYYQGQDRDRRPLVIKRDTVVTTAPNGTK
jgi:hypothetical protein